MGNNTNKMQKSNGAELQCLADIVPLAMPMSLSISLGNLCNLKCNYCYHGSPQKEKDVKSGAFHGQMMTREMVDLIVEQSLEFGAKYKQATLVGSGEPLVNKDLVYIIKQMKRISEKVKLVTNATLLNETLSKEMIDAGLDLMKISFQGMTDQKYQDICGANISVDDLIEQIKYFYQNKKQCKVHVKIVDAALDAGEEELFYETFSKITDSVWVEKLSEVDDTGRWTEGGNRWMNQFDKIEVCHFPFYYIYIDQLGNVYPCCNAIHEVVVGNIKQISIKDIWEGNMKKMQEIHLKEGFESWPGCKDCITVSALMREENYLDHRRKEILERI